MIFALNLGLKAGLELVILPSTASSLIWFSFIAGIFAGRSDMLIGLDFVMGSGFGTSFKGLARRSLLNQNFLLWSKLFSPISSK